MSAVAEPLDAEVHDSGAHDPANMATVGGHAASNLLRLTMTLSRTEFKLRYYGSSLGYFWAVAKPLLLFGVLYFAFTKVIRFGDDVPHYPVYLLTAIVCFNYFSEATGRGVRSLVERESLIRKMPIPLLVIPLAISMTSVFNLALELIVVIAYAIASGVHPAFSWLEAIPLVLLLIAFTTAVTSLLANLYVTARDTAAIWDVGLQLIFWTTPIVYTIAFIPDNLQKVAMMNPLAAIITQLRHALIDPSAPSAAAAIGSYWLLLIPLAIAAGIMALSVYGHRRIASTVVERL